MVLNTTEFCHDHTDVLSAFCNLDVHQLFNGNGITKIVAHGVEVIKAVGVGHILQEGIALTDFVVVAMQVANHRLQADNGFAIECDRCTEHTVSGWMMRTHVDYDAVCAHAAFTLNSVALK